MPAASDSFEAKLDRALSLLEATSMWRATYDPPLHRTLRAAGINIPPPHLTGFVFNAIFNAAWFGIIWGISMWMLIWSDRSMSVSGAATSALIAGSFFGVWMAVCYQLSRRKHMLPTWDEV